MKSLKRFVTVMSLTMFIITGLIALHGTAQALELKFGHVGAPGSLFTMCVDEFTKRANDKLGGKAKVVGFGSSQLGKDEDLLKKLKLGTVDFSLPSTVMSSVSDMFGVFEMPYLIKDRKHMRKVRDQIFFKKLEPAVEKEGYKVIAVWENGFRDITNSKKPIVVPADLKGLKLRIPKGEWRMKMFQAYGANPTPMALSEVFVALQTGVIDGQENPLAQIASQKFQEVQKYLSRTGHVYTPAYVLVGKKKWESLPADVRKTLEDVAIEMQEYVYTIAEKLEDDLLVEMKKVLVVNEADKKAFVAASDSIYSEFDKEVPGGKELVQSILRLAN